MGPRLCLYLLLWMCWRVRLGPRHQIMCSRAKMQTGLRRKPALLELQKQLMRSLVSKNIKHDSHISLCGSIHEDVFSQLHIRVLQGPSDSYMQKAVFSWFLHYAVNLFGPPNYVTKLFINLLCFCYRIPILVLKHYIHLRWRLNRQMRPT